MKPEKILDAMELKLAELEGLASTLVEQSPLAEPNDFDVFFSNIGTEIAYLRELCQ